MRHQIGLQQPVTLSHGCIGSTSFLTLTVLTSSHGNILQDSLLFYQSCCDSLAVAELLQQQ